MQKREKEFLSLVGYELIPLDDIESKLKWSTRDVDSMAAYLAKEGLIRRGTIYTETGAGLMSVSKPMDKRSWRDKYWFIIAVCSYLLGIMSFVVKDYIGSLLK